MKGKAWKFGNNIDTDLIVPARYLNTSEPGELAAHALEDAEPAWAGKKKPGDFIVAGENFGCGSSREHAPIALKAAGVSAVIAKSFARIFYRNAINIGLPILESPAAAQEIKEGAELNVNLAAGKITDLSSGKIYAAQPFPGFLQQIIKAGGLINYLRAKRSRSARRLIA